MYVQIRNNYQQNDCVPSWLISVVDVSTFMNDGLVIFFQTVVLLYWRRVTSFTRVPRTYLRLPSSDDLLRRFPEPWEYPHGPYSHLYDPSSLELLYVDVLECPVSSTRCVCVLPCTCDWIFLSFGQNIDNLCKYSPVWDPTLSKVLSFYFKKIKFIGSTTRSEGRRLSGTWR